MRHKKKSPKETTKGKGFPKEPAVDRIDADKIKELLGPGRFEEIAKMGEGVIPVLIGYLKPANGELVRMDAAEALGYVGDVSTVNLLIEYLNEENWLLRLKVAEALRMIIKRNVQHKWKERINVIVEALQNDDLNVQNNLAWSLNDIAKNHPEAVAQKIIEAINGKLGDELQNPNTKNKKILDTLHEVMLECEKVIEDAA